MLRDVTKDDGYVIAHKRALKDVEGRTWHDVKQELSYRKQIACQLRTQYVEGTHKLNITP